MSDTPRTDATHKLWKTQIRTYQEIWDFARQLERELAEEKRASSQFEHSLNAALDQGVQLTEKIATLENALTPALVQRDDWKQTANELADQLAAANDRANNAEQAALNWSKAIEELTPQKVSKEFRDPCAGIQHCINAQGVRYLYHPDHVPAADKRESKGEMLGYVP